MKILPEFKILAFQNREFQNWLISRFWLSKIVNSRVCLNVKILALQNPEFKILAVVQILAFQNPEFKILADFKILALLNSEFQNLADFKILAFKKF